MHRNKLSDSDIRALAHFGFTASSCPEAARTAIINLANSEYQMNRVKSEYESQLSRIREEIDSFRESMNYVAAGLGLGASLVPGLGLLAAGVFAAGQYESYSRKKRVNDLEEEAMEDLRNKKREWACVHIRNAKQIYGQIMQICGPAERVFKIECCRQVSITDSSSIRKGLKDYHAAIAHFAKFYALKWCNEQIILFYEAWINGNDYKPAFLTEPQARDALRDYWNPIGMMRNCLSVETETLPAVLVDLFCDSSRMAQKNLIAFPTVHRNAGRESALDYTKATGVKILPVSTAEGYFLDSKRGGYVRISDSVWRFVMRNCAFAKAMARSCGRLYYLNTRVLVINRANRIAKYPAKFNQLVRKYRKVKRYK